MDSGSVTQEKTPSLRIGIYGISGQSGKAYLADLLEKPGVRVYGYARPSENGRATVEAIHQQGGLELQRPPKTDEPTSRMIPLGESTVGHDLDRLIEESDLILFTHPSVYHEETARQMQPGLSKRRVPLILSPSRTFATPYLWRILGDQYPIFSLQTCPYACKSYSPGSSYIKRRKTNWIAALEGDIPRWLRYALQDIFPQVIYSHVPATTSLGNIGAIFHPAPYVLNLEAIQAAAERGDAYSFYMQGIAGNPDVGRIVGEIDQIRLRLAKAAGCTVFGLEDEPREDDFLAALRRVSWLENNHDLSDRDFRNQRRCQLQAVSHAVISAQLWLTYTYGVERLPGETLARAIGRTPNFQDRSYPQKRYADEDIPTGLVPLEALAQRLAIPHQAISDVIDRYHQITGHDFRASGRNLQGFETDFLLRYLRGETTHEGQTTWTRLAS